MQRDALAERGLESVKLAHWLASGVLEDTVRHRFHRNLVLRPDLEQPRAGDEACGGAGGTVFPKWAQVKLRIQRLRLRGALSSLLWFFMHRTLSSALPGNNI